MTPSAFLPIGSALAALAALWRCHAPSEPHSEAAAPVRVEDGTASSAPPATTPEATPEATAGDLVPGPLINPVLDLDFPDPAIIAHEGQYYAFCTNAPARSSLNVPTATSSDLRHWTMGTDALPQLPEWASRGATWAPSVVALAGGWRLFFVAHHRLRNMACIGVASSTEPTPTAFMATSDQPLTCAEDGAVDPSAFVHEDGTAYLLWMQGQGANHQPTLMMQALGADGASLVAKATTILSPSQGWEGGDVRAPSLLQHGGRFVLFYGSFGTGGTLGVATASSLLGPYASQTAPWARPTTGMGPNFFFGGPDAFRDPSGQFWLAYHSRATPSATDRQASVTPLSWSADLPVATIARSLPLPLPPPEAQPAIDHPYTNPVMATDFADPAIMLDKGTFYAYATYSGSKRLQVASSPDLVTWSAPKEAMPQQPGWATTDRSLFWAPDVCAMGGAYAMYFTAKDSASGRQCVGAATAASPEGPFVPRPGPALVCQAALGGSIDASCFREDDGSRWLIWKNDGNAIGVDASIWAQPLTADGLALSGSAVALFHQTEGYEGSLVEAPFLVKNSGRYFMFYSGNAYFNDAYFVAYATSDKLTGPYKKQSVPWLATSSGRGLVIGPGGASLVTLPAGDMWMVYHQWNSPTYPLRDLNLAQVKWGELGPTAEATRGMVQAGPGPVIQP